MDELVLELGFIDDLSGRQVCRICFGSRTVLRDSGLLGLEDDLVGTFHDLRRISEKHRTGHVGTVAVVFGAEIEKGDVSLLQPVIAWDIMGHRGVGSECSNCIECIPGSAEFPHTGIHPGSDLLLGDPFGQVVRDLACDFGGDLTCLAGGLDLLLVLDGIGLRQGVGGIGNLELGPGQLPDSGDGRIRGGMGVEPHFLTILQRGLEMLNQVIPVVIDLDIAFAAAGGLLFQNGYYDVEGSILFHDGVRTLEDSRILLRQIPECRIEERLPVVGDDDCIEVAGVLHQPLGPGAFHVALKSLRPYKTDCARYEKK